MPARVLTMPRNSLRDTLRQADTAQAIAGELASLVFCRRLVNVDPQQRAVLMELAETCVTLTVEEFKLDGDDLMDEFKRRTEA